MAKNVDRIWITPLGVASCRSASDRGKHRDSTAHPSVNRPLISWNARRARSVLLARMSSPVPFAGDPRYARSTLANSLAAPCSSRYLRVRQLWHLHLLRRGQRTALRVGRGRHPPVRPIFWLDVFDFAIVALRALSFRGTVGGVCSCPSSRSSSSYGHAGVCDLHQSRSLVAFPILVAWWLMIGRPGDPRPGLCRYAVAGLVTAVVVLLEVLVSSHRPGLPGVHGAPRPPAGGRRLPTSDVA